MKDCSLLTLVADIQRDNMTTMRDLDGSGGVRDLKNPRISRYWKAFPRYYFTTVASGGLETK